MKRFLLLLGLLILVLWAADSLAGEHDYEETRQVTKGNTFVLRAHRGDLHVDSWDRDELGIFVDQCCEPDIELRQIQDVLILSIGQSKEDWSGADIQINMPRWMPLEVEGNTLEVDVENLDAPISVEVIDGSIRIVGGKERVFLRSLQGQIQIKHAEAHIDVSSSQENVTVLDSKGQILAESVGGDIRIAGVESDNVEAISFGGDVLYDGSIEDGGDYYFSTHSGDVEVGLGEENSASVTIVAEKGNFSADFELRLLPMTNRERLEFVLGDGKAKVRAESFSGDIFFFDPKKGRSKRHR